MLFLIYGLCVCVPYRFLFSLVFQILYLLLLSTRFLPSWWQLRGIHHKGVLLIFVFFYRLFSIVFQLMYLLGYLLVFFALGTQFRPLTACNVLRRKTYRRVAGRERRGKDKASTARRAARCSLGLGSDCRRHGEAQGEGGCGEGMAMEARLARHGTLAGSS